MAELQGYANCNKGRPQAVRDRLEQMEDLMATFAASVTGKAIGDIIGADIEAALELYLTKQAKKMDLLAMFKRIAGGDVVKMHHDEVRQQLAAPFTVASFAALCAG